MKTLLLIAALIGASANAQSALDTVTQMAAQAQADASRIHEENMMAHARYAAQMQNDEIQDQLISMQRQMRQAELNRNTYNGPQNITCTQNGVFINCR